MNQGDIYFNPWDPNFRANPYPHYQPLFGSPPRVIDMFGPTVLAARYKDVSGILRDHSRFSSVQPKPPEPVEGLLDVFGGAATMLFSDPPVHTRLRKLVMKAFTPRRVREFEPRIRQLVSTLFDKASRRAKFEVIADLATPLPVMVIAGMLGVPPEQYEIFKHWSDLIIEVDNTLPGQPIPDEARKANHELRGYFADQIERRRGEPGDDLMSALVAAHEENESLSADELLAFVVLLLLAGNETTTNLIGNGILALGRNPDQMGRLRSDRSLIASCIDEMLRYDGPVQSTVRYATQDADIDGTKIAKDTSVFVIVAAANRDPEHFPNPDKFDVARAPNDHVAFGEGIHFCIGSALARLEAAVAVEMALERFPKLRLADPDAPVTYKGSYFLRGLSELPMSIA
ncbi:MAG TPA: cytochrome P450 [Candidatus Binataceae bacterium]